MRSEWGIEGIPGRLTIMKVQIGHWHFAMFANRGQFAILGVPEDGEAIAFAFHNKSECEEYVRYLDGHFVLSVPAGIVTSELAAMGIYKVTQVVKPYFNKYVTHYYLDCVPPKIESIYDWPEGRPKRAKWVPNPYQLTPENQGDPGLEPENLD